MGADAGIEVRGGEGGWAAAGADAVCSGLDLLVDGEEGVQGAVDRGGVWEVGLESRLPLGMTKRGVMAA